MLFSTTETFPFRVDLGTGSSGETPYLLRAVILRIITIDFLRYLYTLAPEKPTSRFYFRLVLRT